MTKQPIVHVIVKSIAHFHFHFLESSPSSAVDSLSFMTKQPLVQQPITHGDCSYCLAFKQGWQRKHFMCSLMTHHFTAWHWGGMIKGQRIMVVFCLFQIVAQRWFLLSCSQAKLYPVQCPVSIAHAISQERIPVRKRSKKGREGIEDLWIRKRWGGVWVVHRLP